MNNPSQKDNTKLLFVHLITMLSMSVMQQLGKIKNPMTGKIEVNLEAAQATIDILDMLERKTKGNLEEDEEKMLKDTLSSLKLNYVETSETSQSAESPDSTKEKADKPKEPSDSGTKESTEKPDESKSGIPSQEQTKEKHKEEPKEPKFHKSYE